ncbi:hypothetical protein AB0F72_15635 [Actinoplanes sp. NPDC023936]|uniref:hypothetical protein n=1 Tax=Actinoplanes sp. NPDC023936 TaxID=3154910 RepID=UPI0033C4D9C1
MRPLGTRRAGLVAGAATVAVLALAGCSAGQVAETAMLDTPIGGVDSQTAAGSVYIRNLQVEFPGVQGYQAGGNAPLELSLYNQTDNEITVSISSKPTEQAQVVSASQVGVVTGGAAPAAPSGAPAETPSAHAPETPAANASETPGAHGSEAPTGPASDAPSAPIASDGPTAPVVPPVKVAPAQFKIGAQGSALFRPTDAAQLQVIGLSDDLMPGTSVNLVFEFSDGSPALELPAPVANPLTPVSRAPGEPAEDHLGEAEHE